MSDLRNILLLVDFHGRFQSSVLREDGSMDVGAICHLFSERGYRAQVRRFWEMDFRQESYRGWPVLYQSPEDPDLHYKGYVEDVLLALESQGAVLIPPFHCFRAHHNKVFMELLRDLSSDERVAGIRARTYGTLEDFLEDRRPQMGPCLLKPAAGAGSKGIVKLETGQDWARAVRRATRSPQPLSEAFKNLLRPWLRWLSRKYAMTHEEHSLYRAKIVIQELVPNMTHDYKVLIYGHKHYVLLRRNRKNDFRASGSGVFEFPEKPPAALLDFASAVFHRFQAPHISMDIGWDGRRFQLLEFQFVHFGNYTLQRSAWHFRQQSGSWQLVRESPVLEQEYVRSVTDFLDAQGNGSAR